MVLEAGLCRTFVFSGVWGVLVCFSDLLEKKEKKFE